MACENSDYNALLLLLVHTFDSYNHYNTAYATYSDYDIRYNTLYGHGIYCSGI